MSMLACTASGSSARYSSVQGCLQHGATHGRRRSADSKCIDYKLATRVSACLAR